MQSIAWQDQAAARCIGCGYSLRGLTGRRCPECGREFDPEDPRTMDMGRVRRAKVPPVEPPGGALFLINAVVVAFILWEERLPGGNFIVTLGYFAGMVLAVVWLTWLVVWVARRVLQLDSAPAVRPGRIFWRWASVPLLWAAAVLLVAGQVPVWVGFRVSRPFLNSSASRAMAAPPAAGAGGTRRKASRWMGVYPVDEIEWVAGGVRFRVSGAGVMHSHGFAYFPGGAPPPSAGYTYRPLDGKWYVWRERF